MFQDMTQYMQLSKQERQAHLDLNDACIEIGTNSQECRALLAHHVKTMMPKGMRVICCHACHNSNCSNPKHLYWGTSGENLKDAYESGNRKLIDYQPEWLKNRHQV